MSWFDDFFIYNSDFKRPGYRPTDALDPTKPPKGGSALCDQSSGYPVSDEFKNKGESMDNDVDVRKVFFILNHNLPECSFQIDPNTREVSLLVSYDCLNCGTVNIASSDLKKLKVSAEEMTSDSLVECLECNTPLQKLDNTV